MRLRILTAALICAFLAGLAWWLYLPANPETRMALGLLGERWYSLSLDGRHLGYWRTRNFRDSSGNWVFESEQRFAMNPYNAVTTRSRRVFAEAYPHPLLSARHLQRRRDRAEGVRIERTNAGYRVSRVPPAETASQLLAWRYTLADYLEFELWLGDEQPDVGANRTVATLDFDRADLVNRGFDVVGREKAGYVIENAAPYSATRIHLDAAFAPAAIRIAGLFDLTRTTKEQALAPYSTLQAASYHIPTDRRLADHTRIARLVLAVEGHDSPAGLFDGIERREQRWQLTLESPPLSSAPLSPADLAATVRIPSDHPDMEALAGRASAGITDDLEKVRALTRFVHGYLAYQPGLPPRSVQGLLTDPRGDCTEFADLLTTLARSLGLPARTVYGLAYADGPSPAFAYHAWNEVYVDGSWIAVDPTWGESRVDATHIPLPVSEEAAMALLTGSVALSFSVLAVEHFQD